MTHTDAVRARSRTITQLDAARAGDVTPQMRAVARKEGCSPEEICAGVASGRIAIPANIHHAALSPEGVGEGLRTKVNVNLGILHERDMPLRNVRYGNCERRHGRLGRLSGLTR